jgi:hypothetical protein
MEIKEIFEGVSSELLTDDVKLKIETLIEAKVAEKTVALQEAQDTKIPELEEKAEEFKSLEADKLEEKAVEFVDNVLLDKIDSYINYVAEEYVKENELAIESGIKSELYESLISSLKGTLKEHNVTEEESSIVEELQTKVGALETKLNKTLEENMEFVSQMNGVKAKSIFEKVTADLSESTKERMEKIAGEFDCDNLQEFESIY